MDRALGALEPALGGLRQAFKDEGASDAASAVGNSLAQLRENDSR